MEIASREIDVSGLTDNEQTSAAGGRPEYTMALRLLHVLLAET